MSGAVLHVKEGIAPVRDRLLTMVLLAALFHGLLILGITFSIPPVNSKAPSMQVLIVTDDVPEADRNDDATYLAQRTQLGSGKADAKGAPRSLARPALERPPARDEEAGATERQLATTSRRTTVRYFGAIEAQRNLPKPSSPPIDVPIHDAIAGDDIESGEVAGKERKELWTTPDTRESVIAPYLDSWRRKVERMGTLNYPAAARAQGATSPVLEVAIDSSGKLENVVIRQSSGSPALDEAAVAILRLASPFEPFPKELAAEYSLLRFAYAWEFAGGKAQRGTLSASPDSR